MPVFVPFVENRTLLPKIMDILLSLCNLLCFVYCCYHVCEACQ